MDFDFGMQRAIFNSFQMHHAAHQAAVAHFAMSHRSATMVFREVPQPRATAPAQHYHYVSQQPSRRPPPPALLPAPTAGKSSVALTSQKGGACAREGILPALPSRGSSSSVTPLKRRGVTGGTAVAGPESPTSTAPPPSRGAGSRAVVPPATRAPKAAAAVGATGTPPEDPLEVLIEREILVASPNVSWDDVAAQPEAKRLLNEALVIPLIFPELFTGLRTPWRGILLYGPPGTGKTLLAKAVATCAKATFFNVSAATLVSRYHGESEKMVRALFRCARRRAPAVIFIDEIDAIMRSRGAGDEHEASRRLKAELLQQLDGVTSSLSGEPSPAGDCGAATVAPRVMLLCTTNTPWDLDDALIRRLEKRIYVALPDAAGRLELATLYAQRMSLLTAPSGVSTTAPTTDASAESAEAPSSAAAPPPPPPLEGVVDLALVAAAMPDTYSGADINAVCREASMRPLRRQFEGKTPAEICALKESGALSNVDMKVTQQDLLSAVESVQPSVNADTLQRYQDWAAQHGTNV